MKFSLGENRGPASTRRDVRVEYAPGKRVIPWVRWYIILIVMLSPLLFFLYRSLLPWFVLSSPASLVMKKASVTMPRTGTLVEAPFGPGAAVRKGEVLFRIVEDNQEVKRERLDLLRLRQSTLAFSMVLREKSEDVGRQEIALAASVLRQAQKDRAVVEELIRQRAATDADLRLARQAENRARADLIRVRSDRLRDQEAQRVLVFQGQRDQALFLADLRQLESEIELLESQLRPLEVLSPLDGKVLASNVSVGETLMQGQPLAEIVDPNDASILVFADGEYLNLISRDAQVEVRFPGKFSLKARLDRFPTDTQTLPGEFSSFIETRRTIRVFLRPVAPIPPEFLIEGLPLTVRWGSPFPIVEFFRQLFTGMEEL